MVGFLLGGCACVRAWTGRHLSRSKYPFATSVRVDDAPTRPFPAHPEDVGAVPKLALSRASNNNKIIAALPSLLGDLWIPPLLFSKRTYIPLFLSLAVCCSADTQGTQPKEESGGKRYSNRKSHRSAGVRTRAAATAADSTEARRILRFTSDGAFVFANSSGVPPSLAMI
jgi:hypothetical protein